VVSPDGYFAREYLPKEAGCPTFLNVDLFAAALSPFDPSKAALRARRWMIEETRRLVRARKSFAFESTLSGKNYASRIPVWQRAGYHVKIEFLSLASPDLALARVRARVEQGGHNVPEAVVRRRFESGLRNFHAVYRDLADAWVLDDNTGLEPVVLASGGTA
jgi:predicted ABC-type ATPase